MYQSSRSSRSGETAETLILIGLILEAIEVVVVLGLGLVVVIFPFFGAIIIGVGVIGLLWVVLVYIYSYKPTTNRDYEAARTPTLVFAILSLLTINLISGVLYIVAWAKLGDAMNEVARTPLYGAPIAPNFGGKFCPACGRQNPLTNGFCEACGTRLS